MALIASEKIFVDPKEEITFIVDRALSSEKDKLLFVVPQSSILLSSPISINILHKAVSRSKKVAIIVTEDEYGGMIARRAGFIVTPKVSQITGEFWDAAIDKKLQFNEHQESRKRELLSNIGLIDNTQSSERADEELAAQESSQKEVTVESEAEITEAPEVSEDELLEIEEPVTEVSEQTSDEVRSDQKTERLLQSYQKPRKESKMVDLDGIQLLAGGDVRNFLNNSVENDKIEDNTFLEEDEDMSDIPERRVRMNTGSTFAGKDFTRIVKKDSGMGSFFSNLFGKKRSLDDDFGGDSLNKARRKKIFIILGATFIILLLAGVVVSAFQFSSVDVSVEFKKEDVSTTANILANPDVTEISFDPVVIPAKTMPPETVSMSKSGEANGEAVRGTKATGFVTIYNTTENKYTLPAGTTLLSPATNNKYIIKKEVVIEAAKVNGNSEASAYSVDDIAIEAIEVGDAYNIPSSSNVSFQVGDYATEFSSGKKLYARAFSDIEGGESETFRSVSKENIDALKEKILPELKAQAETKLRSKLETGYRLLPETIELTESSVTSTPKEGEESKDGAFSLTVEVTATALAIKNDDLKSAGAKVLAENSSNTSEDANLVVDSLKLPDITKVEDSASGAVLTITTAGSVGAQLTDAEIRDSILGKSIADARIYLSEIENLETYRITYSPSFVPEFLRFVPNDASRISVKIR